MVDYNYLVDLIDNGYECEYLDYKSIQYNKVYLKITKYCWMLSIFTNCVVNGSIVM